MIEKGVVQFHNCVDRICKGRGGLLHCLTNSLKFKGLNNLSFLFVYTNIKFYHHSSLLSSLPTCFHKLCIVIVIEVKQTKTNLQKYITTPSPHTTLQREPKKVQQKVIFERRLERLLMYAVQCTVNWSSWCGRRSSRLRS